MTSQGLNKVLRGNLNLKPFILSKNSADIVNGYVQRLYQQLPENLKRELMRPRPAEAQHEACGLVKNLRIPVTTACGPNSKPSKSSPTMATSARSKLLKTPNFKIYNNRKYTSSATSSSVSIHRNSLGERRKRLTRAFGTMTRLTTSPAPPKSSPPPKVPLRHFTASTHSRSPRAPSVVCKDLMPVNTQLKKQIRLSRPKPLSETVELPRKVAVDLTLCGWNHPPPEHLKKLSPTVAYRKPPPMSLDRGLLNLMEFKKMPFNTDGMGKCSQWPALKSRHDCESLEKDGGAKTRSQVRRVGKNSTWGNVERTPRSANAVHLVQSSLASPGRETYNIFRKYQQQ